MSEYNQFIEYKPQMRKVKCEGDMDSCSGEGMLNTEAIRNAPGLTPLRFVNEIKDGQESFSEISVPLTGKTLKNSSGLNTLRPFDEIHDRNLDSDFEKQNFQLWKCPGEHLSDCLHYASGNKINKIRVIE